MQKDNSNSNDTYKKIWDTDSYLKKAYDEMNFKHYFSLLNHKGYGSLAMSILLSIFLLSSYNQMILPAMKFMTPYMLIGGISVHLGLLIIFPRQFWEKNIIGLLIRLMLTFFYFVVLLRGLESWFQYTFEAYSTNDWFLTLLIMGALLFAFLMIFMGSKSKTLIASNIASVALAVMVKFFLFGEGAYDMNMGTRWVILTASIIIGNTLGFYISGRVNEHKRNQEQPIRPA